MQNHKTKVLFFLFGGVGGAERMTVTMAKCLPLDQYEVKFVVCGTMTQILDFIPKDYEVLRIKWHNIHCFPVLRLWWIIKQEKPDYVFSSTIVLNYRLIRAARRCGVKCVVRNNTTLTRQSANTIKELKKEYPFAHKIVCQQEEMQEELLELLPTLAEKTLVLHNILDTETIDNRTANATCPFEDINLHKFLFVGRFSHVKAIDILYKAFAIVHELDNEAHLYCVGSQDPANPDNESNNRLLEQFKLNDFVHHLGFDPNPYKWIKYADCVVLSSRNEGLPNVLIEAQYLGTPVAATRCIPVIGRIVSEGINGFTVPNEDYRALAEAMIKAQKLRNVDITYRPSSNLDIIQLFAKAYE